MFHKTLCQGLRYGSAPQGNSVQSGGHHTLEMCYMQLWSGLLCRLQEEKMQSPLAPCRL